METSKQCVAPKRISSGLFLIESSTSTSLETAYYSSDKRTGRKYSCEMWLDPPYSERFFWSRIMKRHGFSFCQSHFWHLGLIFAIGMSPNIARSFGDSC